MKVRALLWIVIPCALLLPARRTASEGPTANPHGNPDLDCAQCHTAEGWTPVVKTPKFPHESTGFVLADAHAQVKCRDCHRSLVFTEVSTACADCHRDAHRGELGYQCESCHTPRTWTNERQMRERHQSTFFPLTGAHASVDCDSCHRGQPNRYVATPTECGQCHQQSYLNARNPNHVTGGYPRDCAGCHDVAATGWRPATFVDHSKTGFPLTGAHLTVSCARCHVGGRFAGTPKECAACHLDDYNRTDTPNHRSAGFPLDCQACHQTSGWRPASFDHNRTRFPLTGAHVAVDCARCHVGGKYAGTPTDCAACHLADYNATTSPNHRVAGFPTDCQACHSTGGWRPATFDHNKTRFPLTGAHVSVDCLRCHVGGKYAGTPTDCFACHAADYNSTSNPNHRAAGFPTSCQQCHTTTGWRPANFDHDGAFFPIYSGRHRGAWTSCNDCHVNPANYRVFECILCHAHTRADMAGKHNGVSGYTYTSAACYRCHPRGVAGN